MAKSLGIHLKVMFRLPGNFSDDFLEYQSTVASFLADEHELTLISEVVSTWVSLHRALLKTAEFGQTTEAQKVFKVMYLKLEHLGKQRVAVASYILISITILNSTIFHETFAGQWGFNCGVVGDVRG